MPTLEQLENDIWDDRDLPTTLIRRCHALRKKPIEEFTIEDLRTLLGQNIGLKHLMPIALAVLDREPLAEGDFYPGDLLSAILRPANWPALESWSTRLNDVCNAARAALPANPKPYEHDGKIRLSAEMELSDAITAFINRRSHKH
jgi:CDI immunity proteins